MAQQIYQAEKIYSFHCIVNIYRKLKKKQKIPDFRGEIQKVKS
jgi:hypothetical protein